MTDLSKKRLYTIIDTGYLRGNDPVQIAREMIDGGADIIQLRAKKETPEQIARIGRKILTVTRQSGIPLIINDHPHIAADIGADGVHVGQDDMGVAEARQWLGRPAIIGKSTHSLEQARAAFTESPDYIGFGPLFATPTKPDYTPIGLAPIAQVRQEATVPFFCIGGIKQDNADAVIASGAIGVVVVSEILLATDIRAICAWYRQKLLAAHPVSH